MRMLEPRIAITGILLVLTLVSGVALSHGGKPYGTAVLTVHKLLSLAAVIATVVTIRHLGAGLNISIPMISPVALAGLLFIALFATGAMLSIGKPDHVLVLAVHRIAPLVATISAGAGIFLLANV